MISVVMVTLVQPRDVGEGEGLEEGRVVVCFQTADLRSRCEWLRWLGVVGGLLGGCWGVVGGLLGGC